MLKREIRHLVAEYPDAGPYEARGKFHYYIVLVLFIEVFFIRFFTETFPVLPRIFQFLDLGSVLFISFVMTLWIVRRRRIRMLGFSAMRIGLYLVWLLVSAGVNYYRIDVRVLASYFILQLGAFIFFIYFINIPLTLQRLLKLVRYLFYIAIIQIAVALLQVPRGLGDSPDRITGTFGFNNTQMLSFLTLFTTGIAVAFGVVGKRCRMHLILLFVLSVFVFYTASWRALWISFPLTLFLIFVIGNNHLRERMKPVVLFLSLFAGTAYFFFMFTSTESETYNAQNKQALRLLDFDYNPANIGKIRALLNTADMYSEIPTTIIFGSGPGTYGSRAFATFASEWGNTPTNVAYGFVSQSYGTDVATKYLLPVENEIQPVSESDTLNGWSSSYIALLGETGIVGFFLFIWIYISVLKGLYGIHKKSVDFFSYVLSLTSIGAVLFLFQISFFADYLGAFRITFPIWMVIGITFRYWEIVKT